MPDEFSEELDDFLNEEGEEDIPGEREDTEDVTPDGSQKPKPDKVKTSSKLQKRYKDLEEARRQDREDMKTMQGQLETQQKFIDRLTGKDENVDAVAAEAERTRRFEETPAEATTELVSESEKRIDSKLDTFRKEVKLKEVYAEIKAEHGVDLDKDGGKILDYLDMFDPNSKAKNPKGVLEGAMKMAGLISGGNGVSTKNLPHVESGSSASAGPAPEEKRIIDESRSRMFASLNKSKGKKNVFGI